MVIDLPSAPGSCGRLGSVFTQPGWPASGNTAAGALLGRGCRHDRLKGGLRALLGLDRRTRASHDTISASTSPRAPKPVGRQTSLVMAMTRLRKSAINAASQSEYARHEVPARSSPAGQPLLGHAGLCRTRRTLSGSLYAVSRKTGARSISCFGSTSRYYKVVYGIEIYILCIYL